MTIQPSDQTEIVTLSTEATQLAGERFATLLQPGSLVLLRGDLGAGKTTFTQGVARGLGIEGDVTSPTFVLINEHMASVPLLHLDAYRLEESDEDDLRDAGVLDLIDREDAIKIIEWPERIAGWLPHPDYVVRLESRGDAERLIRWQASPENWMAL